MKVTTLVLNADGEPHFQAIDELDADMLLRFAQDREDLAREKGVEWTMGAVTFYGAELLSAVETGENDDVTRAVTNMMMAAWLYDSLFCGVSAEQYKSSDFEFTVSQTGAVAHTRVPAVFS